jgi:hypothetical protein
MLELHQSMWLHVHIFDFDYLSHLTLNVSHESDGAWCDRISRFLMSHHFDGVLHLTVLELKLWAGRLSLTGTGFLDQGPLISLSFTSPNGNVIVFTVIYSEACLRVLPPIYSLYSWWQSHPGNLDSSCVPWHFSFWPWIPQWIYYIHVILRVMYEPISVNHSILVMWFNTWILVRVWWWCYSS